VSRRQEVALPLDAALLARARARSAQSRRPLVEELADQSGLEPRMIVPLLADLFGLRAIGIEEMSALRPAFEPLPLAQALARHCVLLRSADGTPTGVVGDPFDLDLQTWLQTIAGTSPAHPLEMRLAAPSDILAYLDKQEQSARATDTLVGGQPGAAREGKSATVLTFASVSEAASPAVRLVNSTLYDALKAGASDVHLESTPSGLAVKYRVDGVLDHAASVGGIDVAEHAISRLKVLAELDIAERRIPQDGSFQV
jgi:general secretion pathway protein E